MKELTERELAKLADSIDDYKDYRDEVLEHVNYLKQWSAQLRSAITALAKYNNTLKKSKAKKIDITA